MFTLWPDPKLRTRAGTWRATAACQSAMMALLRPALGETGDLRQNPGSSKAIGVSVTGIPESTAAKTKTAFNPTKRGRDRARDPPIGFRRDHEQWTGQGRTRRRFIQPKPAA